MCLHNSVGSTWQTTGFVFLWTDKLQSGPIGLHEIVLDVLVTSTTRNVLHIRHWHLSLCFDSARFSACLIRSVPSLRSFYWKVLDTLSKFVSKSSTIFSAIMHDSRTESITEKITQAWKRITEINTKSHQDRQYRDNNSFLFPAEDLFERKYANIRKDLFF